MARRATSCTVRLDPRMETIPMPAFRPFLVRLMCIPLAVASSAALAQEVTLKVSHFLPPNSNYQKGVLEPWCDKIAKDSGGKLKCQIYPAMQLGGTPPQLADQVKNAVADIVMTSPSYSSGRFPYTEALEQPFTLPPGGLSGSKAMWEYSQKYACLLYTSPSPRDGLLSRMPSSA